jgi:hypothetical protein
MQISLFRRWDGIHRVLSMSSPYGLEIECLDEFINNITSEAFNGDYMEAADQALYEWDI